MNEKTLIELLGPVVQPAGLELDALEVLSAGKRKLLRITLDGDGHRGLGPDLDQIAAATRAISAALEDSNAVGSQPYTLEVSTRGIGRPLARPAHYRRNRGRLLVCTLIDGATVTGRIVGNDESSVILDVGGDKQDVGFEQITRAIVQVELNRPSELDEVSDDAEQLEED